LQPRGPLSRRLLTSDTSPLAGRCGALERPGLLMC
jgi:hypothetical protein